MSKRVVQIGVQEVAARVREAREAEREWARRAASERAGVMRGVRAAFLDAAEAIVDATARETGKPRAEAWLGDFIPNVDLFGYWIKEAPRLQRPERVWLNPINFPRKRATIELVPRGVVALITPWNYPVSIPLRTIVPALLAGNAVVWKPSEVAPEVAGLVADTFEKGGLPRGLLTTVMGEGDVGDAVVRAEVDHVVFTGGLATGRLVVRAAAERMTSCSLELGGKDAAIVLDDANLDRAIPGVAWGAFTNAGQNCAGIERVFVTREVSKKFIDGLVAYTATLKSGSDVGALTTDRQFEIVKAHVADAVERGGKVRVGGKPGRGKREFEPTVLTDVARDAKVFTDETFGPVVPVEVVETADEAVRRANEAGYGLTASLWTADEAGAVKRARVLECGVVSVNNHAFTGAVPSLPWTGVKGSGHGITNSKYAFFELTRPKTLLVDRLGAAREPWWFPYGSRAEALGKAMVEVMRHGPSRVPGLLGAFASRWKETE
ncbi:MAG: aldehyde dehydrogenase family protein [Deltaproteobacteria bacterium]|nr:aldehyde dehydrogenase family protein [Deltaproteobacteria bacterium]